MHHSLRLASRALGCALFLLTASSCESPTSSARGGDCPAAQASDCRVDQRGCEMAEGAASCFACERGQTPDETGACVPLAGDALAHVFADFTVEPGGEVLGLCQSWTLNNDEDLFVNTVELWQNAQSHHSNWTFVPDTLYDGPDGVWRCRERDYSQLTAAVAGGVLYAQSTQAEREVQQFPPGAVVRIPAHSRIIGDVHLLNYLDTEVTGHAELTLYTLPPEEAMTILAPFHLTFEALDIPARSTSRFASTCALREHFMTATGAPPAIQLYYALPHTHAQGRRFFLQAVGGPRDGEMLIDVVGFNGEARGRNYAPPIDLTGLEGLRFGCEFDNPRAENIRWGFGDQEMCEVLGFISSPLAFESSVDTLEDLGEEDGLRSFTGECSTLVIPWDGR